MRYFKILSFFIFPFIVFFVHLFFSFFGVYNFFPWMDIPMHFLGGFAISYTSILFLNFFSKKNLLTVKNSFIFVLVIASIVSLLAILWEFYEFFLKTFFSVNTQPSLEDTLLDLFMGVVGGIFGAIGFRKLVSI